MRRRVSRLHGGPARRFVRPSAEARVALGAVCAIGADALLFSQADHPMHPANTFPLRTLLLRPEGGNVDAVTGGGVSIGNDAWVGVRAILLSTVTVGNGAVIGAVAVVTRSLPPYANGLYAIVAGNPAWLLRDRFDGERIATLLEVRWWDWPDSKIAEREEVFYGPVAGFLGRARGEDG